MAPLGQKKTRIDGSPVYSRMGNSIFKAENLFPIGVGFLRFLGIDHDFYAMDIHRHVLFLFHNVIPVGVHGVERGGLTAFLFIANRHEQDRNNVGGEVKELRRGLSREQIDIAGS